MRLALSDYDLNEVGAESAFLGSLSLLYEISLIVLNNNIFMGSEPSNEAIQDASKCRFISTPDMRPSCHT